MQRYGDVSIGPGHAIVTWMLAVPGKIVAVMMFLAYAGIPAHAQSADVTLSLVPGQRSVVARYTLSHATDVLRFAGDGDLRKRTWRPDGGATLSADGRELHLAVPTRQVAIRMLPFARDGEVDRVYNPVLFFGDGRAAAVYSEYLLPKNGGVVRLANGGMVLGRAVARGASAWMANDVATYLVVGETRTIRTSDHAMTLDGMLPRWIVDGLANDASALMRLYRSTFADGPRRAPWIIVTFDPAATGDGPSFRGDTNPGMIRLNLMGDGWIVSDPARARSLVAFIAHELMHVWNAGVWSHEDSVPVWLYEGGADAAALDALRRLGRASDEDYRDAQVANLARCAGMRGKTLADKVGFGGASHYACGASVFHLATSMLGERSPRVGPLDIWKTMFEATRERRVYALGDLQRALSKHSDDGDPAVEASPLDDLVESKLAWDDVLKDRKSALHIHSPNDAEQLLPDLAPLLLDTLVIDLVMKDCRGGVSVYSGQQVYRIDALPSCRTIKANMTARSLGGFSMHDESPQALAYARERCRQGLPVLFTGDDARELTLPCAQWIDVPPGMVVPDPVS